MAREPRDWYNFCDKLYLLSNNCIHCTEMSLETACAKEVRDLLVPLASRTLLFIDTVRYMLRILLFSNIDTILVYIPCP